MAAAPAPAFLGHSLIGADHHFLLHILHKLLHLELHLLHALAHVEDDADACNVDAKVAGQGEMNSSRFRSSSV